MVCFDILACDVHSVVRSADHYSEKWGFTHVRVSNLLGGLVITFVVLVFENVEESILLPDHSLPAAGELDVQLRVVLDANVVALAEMNNIRIRVNYSGTRRTYAAFLYSSMSSGFTRWTGDM